jgi:uncharacterized protein
MAVSGLANAGKTIFITQLVSHLEHFKRARFELGRGRTITDVQHMPLALPGVQPFPYAEARAHLLGRDPGWPPATRQVTGIRLEFTLVDEAAWLFKRPRYGLNIYDFPGELLGDLNMPDRSFDDWSTETLRRLRDPVSPLRVAGQRYLPCLEHLHGVSAGTLVQCYHEALEAAVQQGATSVTPGGWIYARGGTEKHMPLDFAPLPSSAPPVLRDAFASEFEAYRRWLSPLVEVFCQCDRHAILVDVLEILRGGQGRYVERKAALRELIRFYEQAHGLLERLARDLATRLRLPVMPARTPLVRAVVVATKADAILEEDRGRLAGLLQEMLESEFKTLDTRLDFRACAAYDATQRETDGQRWVITGRVPADPAEARPRAVARLPQSWPDHAWDGSAFRSFRTYLPPRPAEPIREDATFPHINLDEIVRALLDLT